MRRYLISEPVFLQYKGGYMENLQGKKFYGWWIVTGGFILNFIGIGIAFNALWHFFQACC